MGGMGGMLGLTLLVCGSAIGLVQLAVRCRPVEHRLGSMIVVIIALSLLVEEPFASVLMLLSAAWSGRFVSTAPVLSPAPDFVPPQWGQL
jgi:hypothetical protein